MFKSNLTWGAFSCVKLILHDVFSSIREDDCAYVTGCVFFPVKIGYNQRAIII